MAHNEISPKEYKIPSRSYGITAGEVAETLLTAAEISKHKELNKATLKVLKEKKKALDAIIK